MLGVAAAVFLEATPRTAIAAGVFAALLACALIARRRPPWAELVVALAV